MVLSSEERQKRLEEFHRGYDENDLDENLKEKTRVMATLSEYFNREMILADECLVRGDESGAAVYSHIAKVIDEALKELQERC
jgi:predicted metal-dependent hydrolase